jgi:hypothetical protein
MVFGPIDQYMVLLEQTGRRFGGEARKLGILQLGEAEREDEESGLGTNKDHLLPALQVGRTSARQYSGNSSGNYCRRSYSA